MSAGFSTSPGGGRFDRLTDSNLLNGRWLGLVFALIGGVIIWSVATVPLSDGGQAILGLATMAVFVLANRAGGRLMTLALIALSCAVSLRYIVWRLTDTLEFNRVLQAVLGIDPGAGGILRRHRHGAGLYPDVLAARPHASAAAGRAGANGRRSTCTSPPITNRCRWCGPPCWRRCAIDYPRRQAARLHPRRRPAHGVPRFRGKLRRRLHHPRRTTTTPRPAT